MSVIGTGYLNHLYPLELRNEFLSMGQRSGDVFNLGLVVPVELRDHEGGVDEYI